VSGEIQNASELGEGRLLDAPDVARDRRQPIIRGAVTSLHLTSRAMLVFRQRQDCVESVRTPEADAIGESSGAIGFDLGQRLHMAEFGKEESVAIEVRPLLEKRSCGRQLQPSVGAGRY